MQVCEKRGRLKKQEIEHEELGIKDRVHARILVTFACGSSRRQRGSYQTNSASVIELATGFKSAPDKLEAPAASVTSRLREDTLPRDTLNERLR